MCKNTPPANVDDVACFRQQEHMYLEVSGSFSSLESGICCGFHSTIHDRCRGLCLRSEAVATINFQWIHPT